jgi:glycosyltransferase involved in cell wall biosynthesis
LENVLQLANSCQKYSDVLFLLLGEGIQAKKLAVKIKDMKVPNIRIQGTIPKQEYQDLLSVCDLGLISLHENFSIPNIPSKTLDYFNVGLPVLASIDKATDYNEVLEQAGAGLWSFAGDDKQLFKNFEVLYANKSLRVSMGINGRNYFEKFLKPEIAYQTILNQINS